MIFLVAYLCIGLVTGGFLLAKGRNGLYGRGGALLFCLLAWPAVMFFEYKYRRFRR